MKSYKCFVFVILGTKFNLMTDTFYVCPWFLVDWGFIWKPSAATANICFLLYLFTKIYICKFKRLVCFFLWNCFILCFLFYIPSGILNWFVFINWRWTSSLWIGFCEGFPLRLFFRFFCSSQLQCYFSIEKLSTLISIKSRPTLLANVSLSIL